MDNIHELLEAKQKLGELIDEYRRKLGWMNKEVGFGRLADAFNAALPETLTVSGVSFWNWHRGKYLPDRNWLMNLSRTIEDCWQKEFAERALEILYPPASVL